MMQIKSESLFSFHRSLSEVEYLRVTIRLLHHACCEEGIWANVDEKNDVATMPSVVAVFYATRPEACVLHLH